MAVPTSNPTSNPTGLDVIIPATLDELTCQANERATRVLRAANFFLMRDTSGAIEISDMSVTCDDTRSLMSVTISPAFLQHQLNAALHLAVRLRTSLHSDVDIADFDVHHVESFTDVFETHFQHHVVAQLWILTELLAHRDTWFNQTRAVEAAINSMLDACSLPHMDSPEWDTMTGNWL